MSFFIAILVLSVIILYNFFSNGDFDSNHSSKKNAQYYSQPGRNTKTFKKLDSASWELVRRKSERWNELGFGDGEDFPGYGKLYDREFQVWYCNVGSKEKKNIQSYKDRNPLHYEPKNSTRIIGEGIFLKRLYKTGDYEAIYTGLDNKNRKRWYFALDQFHPTGIETYRALVKVEDILEEEIIVPEGWTLVRRNSPDWFKNGFGDGKLFPGYGKIYERTFEVWYCKVGSKERIIQPEFKDKAILNFYNGICDDLSILIGENLKFESLSKSQGYIQLLTTLNIKERKRWYFGLKKTEPTYNFTNSA